MKHVTTGSVWLPVSILFFVDWLSKDLNHKQSLDYFFCQKTFIVQKYYL